MPYANITSLWFSPVFGMLHAILHRLSSSINTPVIIIITSSSIDTTHTTNVARYHVSLTNCRASHAGTSIPFTTPVTTKSIIPLSIVTSGSCMLQYRNLPENLTPSPINTGSIRHQCCNGRQVRLTAPLGLLTTPHHHRRYMLGQVRLTIAAPALLGRSRRHSSRQYHWSLTHQYRGLRSATRTPSFTVIILLALYRQVVLISNKGRVTHRHA